VKRIGLIGGLSWESTGHYYSLLNQLSARERGPWNQPPLIVDSLDFSEIVRLQEAGDWDATARVLADSARRLEAGGASVLGICANTMHMNYDAVAQSVSIPVIDIRSAVASELFEMGATSLALLGTRYLMESDFYSGHLEAAGVSVIKPVGEQVERLQSIIFEELTQGIVSERARGDFMSIAADCRARGGEVIGLCCTEFAMLMNLDEAPWPFIDSTEAHVKALLCS
jgi:aspartate racemase